MFRRNCSMYLILFLTCLGAVSTSPARNLSAEPPMFTVKPKDNYQGQVNSEVKMPCEGIGQPRPTTSWRRAEGEKLPKDRSVIRGGNLTIRGLKKEDHGRYECVLENEIATLVTSTLLLVESTTPHAPTNVSANISAFASTLTWLPAYDGGYEQSYVVWYRLADQGDSDWRTIRVLPDGATTVTIYNLTPDTEYDFQVLSRNFLGDGMFSVIVKSRTKRWDFVAVCFGSGTEPSSTAAGPKPWSPRNVTVEKKPEGVRITWQPPLNLSVPVAFYFVEYRTLEKSWQRFEPVYHKTQYIATNLPPGTYFFRVFSFSITSMAAESPEVQFQIPGINHEQNKSNSITAGVVGEILFFIAAFVLSFF